MRPAQTPTVSSSAARSASRRSAASWSAAVTAAADGRAGWGCSAPPQTGHGAPVAPGHRRARRPCRRAGGPSGPGRRRAHPAHGHGPRGARPPQARSRSTRSPAHSAASRIRRAIAKDSTRPSPRAATAVASASARRTVVGLDRQLRRSILGRSCRRCSAEPSRCSSRRCASRAACGGGLARQQDPQQRATPSGRVEHRGHRRLLRSLDGVGHRGRVREGLARGLPLPGRDPLERHAAAPPQSGSALPARARRALRLPRQRPPPPRRARSGSGAPPGVAGAARLVREPGRSGRGSASSATTDSSWSAAAAASACSAPASRPAAQGSTGPSAAACASESPTRSSGVSTWARSAMVSTRRRTADLPDARALAAARRLWSCTQSSMRENRSVRNSCSSTSWRSWEEARRNVWNSPWGSSATCWNWVGAHAHQLATSTPDLGCTRA